MFEDTDCKWYWHYTYQIQIHDVLGDTRPKHHESICNLGHSKPIPSCLIWSESHIICEKIICGTWRLDSVTVMQYANYFRTVCWKQNRNKYANIPMKIIWYCIAVFAVSYWPLFRWSLGNLFFARDLSPEALHLLVNQSPVTCSACLVHPCLEPSCETNVEMLVQKRRWWLRARLQYLQW